MLLLQADPAKYGQVVRWIHKLTAERAKVLAIKMKNHQVYNMIQQKTFLNALLKRQECLPGGVLLLPHQALQRAGRHGGGPVLPVLTPGPPSCPHTCRSCESAFLSRSAPTILDFLAPLMLAIEYLTQLEGPMWRQNSGTGLADGYFIYYSVNKGQLFLSLYKAAIRKATGVSLFVISCSLMNVLMTLTDGLL